MKLYKTILGTFLIVATLVISMFAILVVLGVTTVGDALADGTVVTGVLGVVGLATVAIAVVMRAMANFQE